MSCKCRGCECRGMGSEGRGVGSEGRGVSVGARDHLKTFYDGLSLCSIDQQNLGKAGLGHERSGFSFGYGFESTE